MNFDQNCDYAALSPQDTVFINIYSFKFSPFQIKLLYTFHNLRDYKYTISGQMDKKCVLFAFKQNVDNKSEFATCKRCCQQFVVLKKEKNINHQYVQDFKCDKLVILAKDKN